MLTGSTTTQVDTGSPLLATYNPCSPWLSVPQKILTLDPLWNTCIQRIAAIHDPDIALQTGPAFSPVTTHIPVTTTAHPGNAMEGPSVSFDLAAKTSPPHQPSARPNPQNQPPAPPSPPAFSRLAPVVNFGSTTITANSASELVIGTQTFKPGDHALVAGTTVSYASNGQYFDIGGTTQYMNPGFAVGTQTLSAGGPAAVVSGKTYSVEAGGSSVVIDGTTEAVSQVTQAVASAQKVWMTIPAYVIDGQTLIAGGLPITSGDTVMSLDPGGESVVVVVSKTMDINDVLGGTALPDAFGEVAFGTNSTFIAGVDSDGKTSSSVSSSVGPPSLKTTAVGGKTKSGARGRVDISFEFIWVALGLGIAAGAALL